MPSAIGNAIKIFIGCIKKEREDIIGVVPKKREILILPFLLSFGILDVPGLNFFKNPVHGCKFFQISV
ncbi:hypothetical protein DXA97_02005 [Clostridium sp. OF09-36]|nr:hypothetical protein DXA97_02005 [Clostridium sp. OF09-36]